MREKYQALLGPYGVRKTKRQKAQFRAWLCRILEDMDYTPNEEKERGLVSSVNVTAGDPDRAEVLLTAHYDTCAVLPVPNFITPRNLPVYLAYQLLLCGGILLLGIAAEVGVIFLWEDCPMWAAMGAMYLVVGFCFWWMLAGPANRSNVNDNTSGVLTLLEIAHALPPEARERVCFVFFDNEEKGLLGSAAFAKRHKTARKKALVLNFDCVSHGDHLHLFPDRRVKKEADTMAALETAFRGEGEKTVHVVRSFGFYPSDQRAFFRGVGLCALRKHPIIGYYMNRIHTRRDTVLEEENIRLLRDGVLRLLEGGSFQG